jgi:hypothetical protein
MPVLLRSPTEADAKHVASLLAELGYPSKEADVRDRLRRSLHAKVAAFSLHSSRARLLDWLVPNSSPIFQPARPFVGSPLLSSRRIIVGGVSAKSLLPARSTSLASITAQALRSPVRSIVLTRTGFTSG